MEKLVRKDISERKEFKRIGYTYTQVLADDEQHVYLYKMSKPAITTNEYELVKGKKYKNPDGSIVYTYPCDEDFGTYGWFICGTKERVTKDICEKWRSLTGHTPVFSL